VRWDKEDYELKAIDGIEEAKKEAWRLGWDGNRILSYWNQWVSCI
jgi:hypothetical protein